VKVLNRICGLRPASVRAPVPGVSRGGIIATA
jgi:hypothetical protein